MRYIYLSLKFSFRKTKNRPWKIKNDKPGFFSNIHWKAQPLYLFACSCAASMDCYNQMLGNAEESKNKSDNEKNATNAYSAIRLYQHAL